MSNRNTPKHPPEQPLVLINDQRGHSSFCCHTSSCDQIQRVDTSKDRAVSGKCNQCLKSQCGQNRHRQQLFRCHLCQQERIKKNVRAVGDAWECRRCTRAKAYAAEPR